jgi:hypothetical protein
MSQIPEAFMREDLTEEQQQTIITWLQNNPGCPLQDLVAFINSV